MGLYFEKEDKEILNEAVTPLQVVEYLGLPGQKIGPNISILCPASDHNDHSYGNCVVYDQGRKCRCFACQRSFTPLSILIRLGIIVSMKLCAFSHQWLIWKIDLSLQGE